MGTKPSKCRRNLAKYYTLLLVRCEAMKAENEATTAQDIQKESEELKELRKRYKKLKEEHASFHDLADRIIEEKDNEISRLLNDNKNLRQSLQSRSQV
ncbi:hypothetical protein RIF29_26002 [Crotalaria pallida]|uniref:Uncharacterized protein n=1 Tax=Crotalaria pallida TaxID=3830 RepID=A0AAN9EN54_CROPI